MFNDQHTGEENVLPGYGKQNPFAVPEGYFDTLSARIMAKIEYADELEGFAMLAQLKKPQPFKAPEGYFGKVDNALEYREELSEFELLSKIGKPVLKEIDAAYFNAMEAKVQQQMEIAEELNQYETLASLEKQNNFAVNAGYFDTIADRVKERYHAESSQSSVLQRIFAHISKPRIAFAYSFILLISAGLIYYKTRPQSPVMPEDTDCHTLACLEKREMLNEKTVNEMNDDNLYEMVDVDALSKQLSSDSTTVADSMQVNKLDSVKNK